MSLALSPHVLHVFVVFSRIPGSQWALEMAKYNVIHKYLLVGVTEQLGDFVALLEATLPRMFHGATTLYTEGEVLIQFNLKISMSF